MNSTVQCNTAEFAIFSKMTSVPDILFLFYIVGEICLMSNNDYLAVGGETRRWQAADWIAIALCFEHEFVESALILYVPLA
jgi:hypothetical protein